MSDLTPQSDAPTPTTDKITQAARETIYLCNFRVSVDGEWLCLRELNDISLTPDPEPAHEDSWEDFTDLVEQMRLLDEFKDPKDPIAIERLNLMNMAKLSIKGLIESALNLGRTLDSDYAPLQQFFVVMEHCLKHGLKSKKTFLGQNKSFWGPLELVEKLTPEAGEITASVKDLPGLKTPLGRGRAWLRLALMQKKLSDYMKTIINRKDLLSEFYEANALMMEEEGAVIAGLLVGLNVIDANLCMKGEDLDSQVGVIDFSMYLKDGGHSSKSTEGDGQITAILDQKNYVEELNRHLSASVNNLQAKVDALEKSNSKLTEELAVANNRVITLQEEVERIKIEGFYPADKVPRADGSAEGQVLGEARKQLKEETQLRLDVERELEVQIGMKQEMELSMKMLEKDICEKHDALVELRQQLDDLRTLNHELQHKSQSAESGSKQKTEIISRLEEKTNQMAGTIKQLETRSKQAERQRDLAEEANRLFKQEFGDKIESLQEELEQLRKQKSSLEGELKRQREPRGGQHHDNGSGDKKSSVASNKDSRQQVEDIRKSPYSVFPLDVHPALSIVRMPCLLQELESVRKENDTLRTVLEEKSSLSSSLSLSQNEEEDVQEQSLFEDLEPFICTMCEKEDSLTRTKKQCKNCRGLFCESCLANELPLPSSINPEQVCDSCYSQLLQQYASSPP
ncbi:protein RUFY3 isoform X4 [Alosa alosa]|uniref:protein RUFY3 isoform X4 n=1 Tax=Alosa alosa TaxID=278164 RepID=UPI00201520E3|nr:protein RUFY3 isoform X4 [Alosa alosa]